jgi:putative lipoprotein
MRLRWAFAIAGAALLVGSRESRGEDEWLGRDKGLHAAASAVIAAGAYAASTPWVEEPANRALVGASVALSAGIAKELWDATGRGDPSWKDLAWDVAGTAIGVTLALLVDHIAD